MCVVDYGLLTYCDAARATLVWRRTPYRTLFVGPWSYVLHSGDKGGAQLAFRLCSRTVRTIGVQRLKNAYGNIPLHATSA